MIKLEIPLSYGKSQKFNLNFTDYLTVKGEVDEEVSYPRNHNFFCLYVPK